MEAKATRLTGVLTLHPAVFSDERGFFLEAWNQRVFDAAVGAATAFVQDNHSRSVGGVLRGLHYQAAPRPQGKLVRVVGGAIWDVAVDIRRSSPTFGRWTGTELSAVNHTQLWVPPGFAHGFVVLGDEAEVVYKATDYFDRDLDRTIRYDDPAIGIDWPVSDVILSEKDRTGPLLADAEVLP